MNGFKNLLSSFISLIKSNKITSIVIALLLITAVVAVSVFSANSALTSGKPTDTSSLTISSNQEAVSSEETVSSDTSSVNSSVSSTPVSSEKPVSSKPAASSKPTVTSKPAVSSKPASSTVTKPSSSGYNYNTNINIEDNVFMDALIYTGYNMKKHRADGNMWVYILASRKKGLGYLSGISFGGGSTGFETTANGKPDLAAFRRGGFVCASFVTYVYYNYLPNVAGIDTSSLPRPDRSYSADSVYVAAKKWVELGYSRTIGFTASGTAGNYLTFKPKEEIPIGSILVFRNWSNPNQKTGSHVCVYAGYKNGMHWVYHTGNKNGPEMCAVERFLFGPDPQWPIAIITTPSNIRMSAATEIKVCDDKGAAVSGSTVTLTETATKKTVNLGKTDKNGVVKCENLSYGEYTVTITLPQGYEADSTSKKVKFTTENNSLNKVDFSVAKKEKALDSSSVESDIPSSSEILSSEISE